MLEQVPPISLYEGWISEQIIKSTVEKLKAEDLCTHP